MGQKRNQQGKLENILNLMKTTTKFVDAGKAVLRDALFNTVATSYEAKFKLIKKFLRHHISSAQSPCGS